ncbi:hypothetical protein JW979_13630 [bacterium]|nr:hypothetical protein [candidate division CSSED10-310 bacterium]
MQKNKVKPIERKPYFPPKLRVIDLVAEEVLAIGCKFPDSGTAPLSPVSCVGNNCAQAGS